MTAMNPDASRRAVVEAALVLLERMGLTPADLTAVPRHRSEVPTFAEYAPVVSAAVSAGDQARVRLTLADVEVFAGPHKGRMGDPRITVAACRRPARRTQPCHPRRVVRLGDQPVIDGTLVQAAQ